MLSLSEILEVAIGLVFVWIVVSVAVMQTQEWIVGWLSIRADGLEEAIWGMLADEENHKKRRRSPLGRTWEQIMKLGERLFPKQNWVPKAPAVVKEIYDHPVVKGLAQKGKKPSYIPADKFAAALFDVVMTAGKAESAIQTTFGQFEEDLKKFEVKLEPEQVEKLRTDLSEVLNKPDDELQKEYEEFKKSHPLLAAKLKELGADETDVEKTKTALQQLSGQLEDLDLSSWVETVRIVQAGLKEVKGLSAVESAFDRVREQYPDTEPVLDALKLGLDSLIQADPPQNENQMLTQIANGAAALATSNPGMKRALDSILANARPYVTQTDTAIALARTNAEGWFDTTMERANGWYKRNRQVGAFAIGLIFAILINVDSVNVATHLWREPALRQAVVAQAERYQVPADDRQEAVGPQDLESLNKTYKDLEDSLLLLDIPIGWEFVEVKPEAGKACKLFKKREPGDAWGFGVNGRCVAWQPPQGWGYLSKLAGLIVTAAAATLGAPFWFDILQKLIGIRSAGKPPKPGSQAGQTQQ
jgi:hypothetical protein